LRDVLVKQPGLSGALGSALQLFGLTPELAEHYVSGVKHGETLESLTVEDRDSDRVLAVMRRRTANPSPAEEREEEAAPLAGGGALAGAGAGERLVERERSAESERIERERVERDRIEREKLSASAGLDASASTKRKTNGGLLEMDERDEERIIPIMREEIRVGRRTVERGGVRVASHTVQRPISEQVHLRETHVDIERRPVDRPLRGDEKAFADDTVEMVEMADEPVVSKQARVVEEVVVRKHVEDRTATISDQVRSTEIEFGKLRPFQADEYRSHFDGLKLGSSFESHLPAYQFGHELHRQKSADRWTDVESYAHDRWEGDNPGTWDKFKDSIRHAWMHARGN
jgi:stress response protein YsnF